jgi:DNA polymerase-1
LFLSPSAAADQSTTFSRCVSLATLQKDRETALTTELKPLVVTDLVPALNPIVVTDGAGLQQVSDFLSRVSVFGFDTETNVVKRFIDRYLRLIQIGDRNVQYLIDLLAFVDGKSELLSEQFFNGVRNRKLKVVGDTLRPALDSKSHLKVGMNEQFEYEMTKWNLGVRLWNVYGIDLAEKVLHAGEIPFFTKGVYSLEGIVARRLGLQIEKKEQTTFDSEEPLTEEQIIYGALDVRLPLAVKNRQADLLTQANLWKTVQIENDALPAFGEMYLNGVVLDRDKWMGLVHAKRQKHQDNIKALDEHFIPVVGQKVVASEGMLQALADSYALLGDFSPEEHAIREQIKTAPKEEKAALRIRRGELLDARKEARAQVKAQFDELRRGVKAAVKFEGDAAINYGSPPQLYEALTSGKFKGINKRTLRSTDDDDLEKLANDFPVIKALKEFRSTEKYLKSYGPTWAMYADESIVEKEKTKFGIVARETDRIHSKINQMGAETGRTSSNEPNIQNLPKDPEVRACFIQPPGYTTITMDMSGAELRIIAEMSGAAIWIDAFKKQQDVHSISTEILYPQEWKSEAEPGCFYYMFKTEELEADAEKFKAFLEATELSPDKYAAIPYGQQMCLKCKCKPHKKRRNGCKTCNFLLCYGGGPRTLALRIGTTVEEASALMAEHERKFKPIWEFLKNTGEQAKQRLEARTLSQRRRKFRKPTWEAARAKAEEKLGRPPDSGEISKQLAGMYGSIEREGKNHPIQGTNADIAKIAMGAGFDRDGKPFMWHLLPLYGALLSNFVHDEFVVWCPPETAKECFAAMGDCIRRAGAELMKRVVMEYEGDIRDYWKK